ncbi:subunit 2 of SUMO-activating enzyme [Chloropicon primus]|nr:subunit 2 of SUMO-activating enzyme [Chloropicon primus]
MVGTSAEGARRACRESKVLAVGAGGIGCELLKTLVLSGFEDITLIDMDTIEISNLNRQFLFRKKHVGQSKAEMAREAALKIAPNAKINAFHGNVKGEKFDVDFFKSFDVVLNGLDNLDARRHVNRMTLAAGVPLVESGTAGYNGQVTVHRKGETECFECQPKPVPKQYPVCTIRNTPDKPIHCIVWSKDLLFPGLFGEPTQASQENGAGEENGAGGEEKDLEISTRQPGQSARDYGATVLGEVYHDAIARLASLEDMWKERDPPKPLDSSLITAGLGKVAKASSAGGPRGAAGESASHVLGLTNSHAVWTVEESVAVFVLTIEILLEHHAAKIGMLGFDKDFDLSVDFVAAASNLRSFCYGIPQQSKFDVKGLAGNIIHAIATTNAIISGLIVLEAQKVLLKQFSDVMTTFVQHNPTRGRLLQRIPPQKPNPKCYVCSKAMVRLEIDVKKMTLGQLVDEVLCKSLAFKHPTVLVGPTMHFESGNDLEDDEVLHYGKQRKKILADLPGGPIAHNALVQVEDYSQDMSVEILVQHKVFEDEGSAEFFAVHGEVKGREEGEEGGGDEEGGDSDDDDLCVVVAEGEGAKRKDAEEGEGERESKKQKTLM